MESRPDLNRIFVTLTINPKIFGAKVVGQKFWDAFGNRVKGRRGSVRSSNDWSEPTKDQFEWAIQSMSTEWNRLNSRLTRKADRAGVPRHGYFRVVELHRNLWPHYHVVIEHPTWKAADIGHQISGWALGTVTQARDVSIEDAIGEVAPYLVSAEGKGKGTKAYQFAAYALPEGFRLHSSSKGFLASEVEPEGENVVVRAFPLRGHFMKHHQAAREWGADSRVVLHPPQSPLESHKPPGGAVATGDASRLYLLALVDAEPFLLTPEDESFLI